MAQLGRIVAATPASQSAIREAFLQVDAHPIIVPPAVDPAPALPPVGGAPVRASQRGSVFDDAGDPALLWHLPAWTLAADPDASFHFDAVQDDAADSDGRPFNRATLRLVLQHAVPADATAALAARPDARLQEIAWTQMDALLRLAYVDADGAAQVDELAGTATPGPDGTVACAFPGLLGPVVRRAFTDLVQTGGATVVLRLTYLVDDVLPPRRRWPPRPGRLEPLHFIEEPESPERLVVVRPPPIEHPDFAQLAAVRRPLMAARPLAVAPMALPLFIQPTEVADTPIAQILVPMVTDAPELQPVTVRSTTVTDLPIPLGAKYASLSYRPAYTLTADGATRPIVSLDDLDRFDHEQSEYLELTALGDVGSRYPTLRALYLGAVSGTVLAIPAAYGIVRTALGCEAACDALVDPGSALGGGARFHLSFTVAPVVDRGDLLRLAADVQAAPSLTGRDWRITLPSDLDRRTSPAFSSPFADAFAFGVGLEPHTFTVGVDVVDDDQPAVAKVNALLAALAVAGPAPLTGRIAVRLDDAYTLPVLADVVLDLRTTAGGGELVIARSGDASAAPRVQDVAPYDVRLRTRTTTGGGRLRTAPADVVVAAGAAVDVPVEDGAELLAVDAQLELPAHVAPALMARFVTFRTTDVQSLHHVLAVNATGVIGDAPGAGEVAELAVTIALDDLPALAVPPLDLLPGRRIDHATIDIPVQSAISGLAATLTIAVTRVGAAAPVSVTVHHDFVREPICVLSPDQLAGA